MGRKKGFDEKKIGAIIVALYNNPDGMWIRRLGKATSLHPSTVSRYVDTVLKPLIEDVSLAGENRAMLRIIRLKPFVTEKLAEGRNIQQIMRLMKLLGDSR